MKRDMNKWMESVKADRVKKPMPVLSFPGISLMDITVPELISNSRLQAETMKAVADRCETAASLSMMDLSVESEAFGAEVRFFDDEVPTVIGRLLTTLEDAQALEIPAARSARTGIYIDAIAQAAELITDRPVFAGVIGPVSLAGRLLDINEMMTQFFTDAELVHTVLEKATSFLIDYIKEYKAVGAHGVVIAEPVAGLLSPRLCQEFSSQYIKQIVDAVQDEHFIIIYHNCGNAVPLVNEILATGSAAYHFGNAIKLIDILKKMPADKLVMGNIDPAGTIRGGSPETVRQETMNLLEECADYGNFVISSGCDIPPLAPWENIDAFFTAVIDYYQLETSVVA